MLNAQNFEEQPLEALVILDFESCNEWLRQNNTNKSDFYESVELLKNTLYCSGQCLGDNKLPLSLEQTETIEVETIINLHLGYAALFRDDKNQLPFEYFKNAYVSAKTSQNIILRKLSILAFLNLYAKELMQLNEQYLSYLEEYARLATSPEEKVWVMYFKNYFNSTNIESPDSFFESSKEVVKIEENYTLTPAMKASFQLDSGLYYKVIDSISKAKSYFNEIVKLPDEPFLDDEKFQSYIFLAQIEASQGNDTKALKFIDSTYRYKNKSLPIRSHFSIERTKAIYIYERLKRYDSAYFNLKNSILSGAQLDYRKNALKVAELNINLETAEKEKQILIEQEQKTKNKNIAIGLGGGLIAVSIIGMLVFQNTYRKKRLAEQQRELEIQKTETILKEQELVTIDAMIEGQEKERHRLAGDLHDSAGATLATARLQFNHIYKNKENIDDLDEVFKKTQDLLDQAYNEIRNMSHLKNSGVMAKDSLIPAIEKLAHQASVSGKLNFSVEHFGLNERFENSFEISVFRILQELVTNIIKHSEATEANISLTMHEDNLNIIVEDNGKGFDFKNTSNSNGLGLSSIATRIEFLEGTLDIDSNLGKNTTILIDIPIKKSTL